MKHADVSQRPDIWAMRAQLAQQRGDSLTAGEGGCGSCPGTSNRRISSGAALVSGCRPVSRIPVS